MAKGAHEWKKRKNSVAFHECHNYYNYWMIASQWRVDWVLNSHNNSMHDKSKMVRKWWIFYKVGLTAHQRKETIGYLVRITFSEFNEMTVVAYAFFWINQSIDTIIIIIIIIIHYCCDLINICVHVRYYSTIL